MEGYFFLCRSKFAGGTFSHISFSLQYECAFPVCFMDSRAMKQVATLGFEAYFSCNVEGSCFVGHQDHYIN